MSRQSTLLQDLEDLESDDEHKASGQKRQRDGEHDESEDDMLDDLNSSGDESEGDNEEENGDSTNTTLDEFGIAIRNVVASSSFNRDNLTKLRLSTRFQRHMKAIAEYDGSQRRVSDDEYDLVLESNKLIADIDENILQIHRFVANIYKKKFPELESLVPSKVDYLRTVKRIGNEEDMTVVELSDLLPSATVMVVSVTGSTTSGVPLSSSELSDCFAGCDEVEELVQAKTAVLTFLEGRMSSLAPNVTALIGSRLAAQLLGLVGGLNVLASMPACNVQVLGQERNRQLSGFSNLAAAPHMGLLQYCDIVQRCPHYLRKKALKIVSAKVAIAGRVDAHNNHPDGSAGARLKEEISLKLQKMEEPGKARTKKALPVPEEKRKSRRGSKRVRRFKERFAMTELRKQQNKMNMAIDEGEYGDSAMGLDSESVTFKDMGKLRAPVLKKAPSLLSKSKKKAISLSSGQTNGMSSSLVFTPVQGLELVNPNAALERVKEANNKWFNSSSGFLSAVPK